MVRTIKFLRNNLIKIRGKIDNFKNRVRKKIKDYRDKTKEKKLFISAPTYWREVLEKLYNHDPNTRFLDRKQLKDKKLTKERVKNCQKRIPLAKELLITNEDVFNALDFLEEHRLIRHEPPLGNDYNYRLTARGFEVALKNETHRDSVRMQKLLIIASSLLVVVTFLTTLANQNMFIANNFMIFFIISIIAIGTWAFFT